MQTPSKPHDNFSKEVARSRTGASIVNRTSGLDAHQITPGSTHAQMGKAIARALYWRASNRSLDYDDDTTKFCRKQS